MYMYLIRCICVYIYIYIYISTQQIEWRRRALWEITWKLFERIWYINSATKFGRISLNENGKSLSVIFLGYLLQYPKESF